MPLKYAFFLLLIFFKISDSSGYKILGIFPFFSRSHYILGNELLKGLAEAGHDVTIVGLFHEKNPPKNGKYEEILIDDLIEKQNSMMGRITNLSSKSATNWFKNPFNILLEFPKFGKMVTELTLNHTKIQRLIESQRKYDVVIVPQVTFEAFKALSTHFDAHLIIFHNVAMHQWMGNYIGYPILPSINAPVMLEQFGAMNFKERFTATLYEILFHIVNKYVIIPSHQELVHKYISDKIDLNEVQYNVSLLLSNSHISINRAEIILPIIKEIAGFHVKPPKKLPDDLQKYLDDSPNGVIYFSMGSNLKSADLPEKTRIDLMNAFSKRKEKILWKFESDKMPGKPDNVRIEKWLPQNDILAHPNVKLFITHGGFLSTTETIYNGVPTIAIPIFGDQQKNAKIAASDGYAFVLNYKDLDEKTMSYAIEEVLSNEKYTRNVKYRSKVFHDRLVKPLDEAIYWVEYVVKHNGAKHLRVNYLNLYWYQIYMLDILAVILVTFVTIIYLVKKLIKKLFSICFSDGKREKKIKKH